MTNGDLINLAILILMLWDRFDPNDFKLRQCRAQIGIGVCRVLQ